MLTELLLFIIVVIYTQSVLLSNKQDGLLMCSTKGIMRFENMQDENVNGNIHFILVPMAKEPSLLKDIPILKRAGCTYSAM